MADSRTLQWVRGLKCVRVSFFAILSMSHPTMGAWIEMKSASKL